MVSCNCEPWLLIFLATSCPFARFRADCWIRECQNVFDDCVSLMCVRTILFCRIRNRFGIRRPSNSRKSANSIFTQSEQTHINHNTFTSTSQKDTHWDKLAVSEDRLTTAACVCAASKWPHTTESNYRAFTVICACLHVCWLTEANASLPCGCPCLSVVCDFPSCLCLVCFFCHWPAQEHARNARWIVILHERHANVCCSCVDLLAACREPLKQTNKNTHRAWLTRVSVESSSNSFFIKQRRHQMNQMSCCAQFSNVLVQEVWRLSSQTGIRHVYLTTSDKSAWKSNISDHNSTAKQKNKMNQVLFDAHTRDIPVSEIAPELVSMANRHMYLRKTQWAKNAFAANTQSNANVCNKLQLHRSWKASAIVRFTGNTATATKHKNCKSQFTMH
jgi:hypothetical protein